MDLEIQMLESQIETVEDISYLLKLNTNFKRKVMHKPHFDKCKCEECLEKVLHRVIQGTGFDPESE